MAGFSRFGLARGRIKTIPDFIMILVFAHGLQSIKEEKD
jgi:hypothetical protein